MKQNQTLPDQLHHAFPTLEEIPEAYRITPMHQRDYVINGETRLWDGATQEVISPIRIRNGETLEPVVLGSYPLMGETEALEALLAAVKAWDNGRGEWPTMSLAERVTHLEDFVEKMVEQRAAVVRWLMWEIGKHLDDAAKEFDRTVVYLKDTIEAAKTLDREGSRFIIEQGIVGQIRRAPIGVGLCMGPFNYPLNETFTTLVPMILMGNTVIFKPPKHGVLLHQPLLEAFRTSFPKGVFNVVYGRGNSVIPVLMKSGKVDILTLIGSSRVADELKKQHPKTNRLRAVLGLDAKNAAIVLENAPIQQTVQECVAGALSFNGQRCTAIKIIFVHRKIAKQFVEQLSEAVNAVTYGMPWAKKAMITPLPEPHKPAYLRDCIEDAEAHGASVMNPGGGTQVGTFVFPAVVYPVNDRMKLYHEEQFGPVIPVLPFDDLETPLKYLEDSEHGQQVSIFGNDPAQMAHLIDPLINLVARVNVNSQCQRGPDNFPFTGRKDSAERTLSVSDALRSYSIRTVVATKLTPENKELINNILHNHRSKYLSTRFVL